MNRIKQNKSTRFAASLRTKLFSFSIPLLLASLLIGKSAQSDMNEEQSFEVTTNMAAMSAMMTNDDCLNAIVIPVATGHCTTPDVSISIDEFTESGAEPSCMNANGSDPDAWYKFTPSVNGNIRINSFGTFGSSNEFAIYDGCGGTELACGSGDWTFFGAVASTEYLLQVWRESAQSNGNVEFCLGEYEEAANDICDDAEVVAVQGADDCTISVSVDILTGTESGVVPSCMNTNGDDPDLWYKFTPSVSGNIRILSFGTFSSSFEYAIYDACLGNELACGNGDWTFFGAVANTEYHLQVWMEGAFTETVQFCLSEFPTATNDDCGNAETVSVQGPGNCVEEVSVDIRTASESGVEPSCMNTNGDDPDLWYKFTPSVTGNIRIQTFGTFASNNHFAVWDGCSGTELACDNGNTTFYGAQAGTEYLLQVWREGAFDNGDVRFCLSEFPEAPNDSCDAALPIAVELPDCTVSVSVDIRIGTESGVVPSCMNANGDDPDLWYSFVSPLTGVIRINGFGTFQSSNEFAIYDACDGTELACDNGNFDFTGAVQGQEYLLQVWREGALENGNVEFCLQSCQLECPADLTIEWPLGFNTNPVPPNTPQDPSIDPDQPNEQPALLGGCAIVSQSYVDEISGPFTENCPEPVWIVTRTWTIEDGAGATYTCIQTFAFSDTTPPDFTACPDDVTVQCDEIEVICRGEDFDFLCDIETEVSLGLASATDNCGDVTVTEFRVFEAGFGDCAGDFVVTRDFRAVDACGNSSISDCEQRIKIIDTTPPLIDCPANVTINCDASFDPIDIGVATATDACSEISVNYEDDLEPQACSTISREWTAIDGCGNATSCTQFILSQNAAPSITCPDDITVGCNDSTDPADTGIATATDNCPGDGGVPVFTPFINEFHYDNNGGDVGEFVEVVGPAGTSLAGWTVVLYNGSNGATYATIDLSTQGLIDDEGNGVGALSFLQAGIQNGGPDGLALVDNGSVVEFLSYEGSFTATNGPANGLTSTDVGVTEPSNSPVGESIQRTGSGSVAGDFGWIRTTESPGNVNAGQTFESGSSFDLSSSDTVAGTCPEVISRVWTATTNNPSCPPESSSCTQLVVVADNDPPTISCPPNTSVGPFDPTDPGATGTASASDDCGPADVTFEDNFVANCPAAPDRIERTWTATDVCGNSTDCLQTIDIDCPADCEVICPEDQIIEWPFGFNTQQVPPNTPQDPSIDPSIYGQPILIGANCDITQIVFEDVISGPDLTNCPDAVWTVTRTFTVIYNFVNSGQCVQTFTFTDNTPPIVSCPSDVTIECDASIDPVDTGEATATDNCAVAGIDFSDTSEEGSCPQNSFILRDWTAVDACGNPVSCTQVIKLVDTQAPQFTFCPGDVTVDCNDDLSDLSQFGTATATDNCDPGLPGGPASDVFINEFHYDNAGGDVDEFVEIAGPAGTDLTGYYISLYNSNGSEYDTLQFNGSIDDEGSGTGAVFVFGPSNGIQNGGSDGMALIDDTGGVLELISYEGTFTAINGPANGMTSVDIGVQETSGTAVGQSLQRKGTGTVSSDFSWNAPSADSKGSLNDGQIFTLSSGGSGGIVIAADASAIVGNCPGVITRTFTAVDACGNENDDCVQMIEVIDNTAPTLDCPADVTVASGNPTDPSATGEATAVDNCSDLTVSFDDSAENNCPTAPDKITRTWTATDACGNTTSCDQMIIIPCDPVDDCDIVCPPDPQPIEWPADFPIDVTFSQGQPLHPSADLGITGFADFIGNCVDPFITFEDFLEGPFDCAVQAPWRIRRVWTLFDSGTPKTCEQIIEYTDTTPPELQDCPGDVTIECGDEIPSPADVTATDNCLVDVTVFVDPFGSQDPCADSSGILYVYVATDICGFTDICEQHIYFNPDTEAPTITGCPDDLTVECLDPVPSAASLSAFDNCDNDVTVTVLVDPFGDQDQCNGAGGILYVYVATDDCGNSTFCEQSIYYDGDNEMPEFVDCPEDMTVECIDDLPTSVINPSATDNCGDVTVTYSPDPFGDSCQGGLAQVWIATDACGLSVTCFRTISYHDTEAPTFVCPPEITIGTSDSTDPSATGEPTNVEDNCNDITVEFEDLIVLDCPTSLDKILRTWTFTDACGNSDACTQIIYRNCDQDPCDIVCPPDPEPIEWPADFPIDVTFSQGQPLHPSADPSMTGTAMSVGDCVDPFITFEDYLEGPFDCATGAPWIIRRVWILLDPGSSAQISCEQIIAYVDNTPPALQDCPGDITIECNEEVPPPAQVTATDNCFADVTVLVDPFGDQDPCAGAGGILYVYKATDVCGNMDFCEQYIYYGGDTTPPTLIGCPEDVTVECAEDLPAAPTVTATDNCGDVTVEDFLFIIDGICVTGSGYTWTATDACGNETSCTYTAIASDQTPPTLIGCPEDVTVECVEDLPAAPTVTATDNCGDVTVEDFLFIIDGICVTGSGYTWIATDACGNETSCTYTAIASDQTPPTLIGCPEDVTVECVDNLPATPTVTATDNCGDVTIDENLFIIDGICATGTGYTWTATDACGNETSCTYTAIAFDLTPPTIVGCPDGADITVECYDDMIAYQLPMISATDNCDISVEIVVNDQSDPQFDCSGQRFISVSAFDDCDNAAYCNFVIRFQVTSPPTFECPDDLTIQHDDSTDPSFTGEPIVTGAACTDTPNTSSVIDDVTIEMNCPAAPDRIYRQWRVTDENCGYSATCVQLIVIECPPPNCEIVCPPDPQPIEWPADFPIDVTFSDNQPLHPSAEPGVPFEQIPGTGVAVVIGQGSECDDLLVEYCDRLIGPLDCPNPWQIERTWKAVDLNGNVIDECIQIIEYTDTTPPTVDCPSDATVEWGDPYGPDVTGDVTVSDNCFVYPDDITFSDEITEAECPFPLIVTRTFTATDVCGISSECVQTILIGDTSPPTIIGCPDDITLTCDEAAPAPAMLTATDNCADVTVQVLVDPFGDQDPCAGDGGILYVYVSTDDCGNGTFCEQYIYYGGDTEAPDLMGCPVADLTVECNDDIPFPAFVTATDNCDDDVTVSFTRDPEIDFELCEGGLLTYTWMATDDCGNSTTCIQEINVLGDQTPPEFTYCPDDLTITCEESTLPPNTLGRAVATDNCAGELYSEYSDVTIDDGCGVRIVRTWTATDDCGNMAGSDNGDDCVQTIGIIDDVAPNQDCPGDIIVQCSDDITAAFEAWASGFSASDDWSDITTEMSMMIVDGDGFSYADMSDLSALTLNGAAAVISNPVLIGDKSALRLMDVNPFPDGEAAGSAFTNQTYSFNNNRSFSTYFKFRISESGGVTGDIDGPGADGLTFTIQPIGSTALGNGGGGIGYETLDPALTVEFDTYFSNGVDPDGNHIGINLNGSLLSEATLSHPTLFNNDDFWCVWVDYDGDSDQLQVRFSQGENASKPVLPALDTNLDLADILGNSPAHVGFTSGAFGAWGNHDICEWDFNVFDSKCYTKEVTWTTTDECGNSTSCSSTFTVEDTEAPTLLCSKPAPMCTGEEITADWLIENNYVEAFDNCGDVTIEAIGPQEVSFGCTYTRTFQFYAIDDCGNMSDTCSVVTTYILDDTPPDITCSAYPDLGCNPAYKPTPQDLINQGYVTAEDACGIVSIAVIPWVDTTVVGCDTIVSYYFKAADFCNQQSEICTVDVKWRVNTPIVLECPDDLTLECSDDTIEDQIEAWLNDVSVSDFCNDVTVTNSFDEDAFVETCATESYQDVTFTAMDDCGDVVTCVRRIEILDTEPPQVICPDDITVNADKFFCEKSNLDIGVATATDACDEPFTIDGVRADDVSLEDPYPVGVTCVTWTATGECSEMSTECVQKIKVVDSQPPTVVCTKIAVSLNDDLGLVEVTDEVLYDGVFDNCYSIEEIIVTVSQNEFSCMDMDTALVEVCATDPAGNTGCCFTKVKVQDPYAPDAVCNDVTVNLENNEATITAMDVADQSTDNADECGIEFELSQETFMQTGIFAVDVTVTDGSGNSSVCMANVTVTGPTIPAIMVSAQLWLEGPMNGAQTEMIPALTTMIPLQQPYGSYFGYLGEEQLTSIPSGMIDWVLLELRDPNDPAIILGQRAALLTKNGAITDLDGVSAVTFDNMVSGNYYVAVRHRNHADVISDQSIQVLSGIAVYDFRGGDAMGTEPMKQMSSGQYALWSGDLNSDGIIDASDRSQAWNDRNQIGYLSSDATLDGIVDASERSITWNNRNKVSGLPQ